MSGGFNPINMVSQIALAAATGGTSLIAQAALQIVSQLAREVIADVGKELGLPQGAIDAALTAFDAAAGTSGGGQSASGLLDSFLANSGASPSASGQAHSALDAVRQSLQESALQEVKEKSGGSSSGAGAKSWIMAMAEAFGERLDAMADDIQDLADAIDKEDPSTTVKYSAATQEFNLLMNTANTAIKTIGEALANTARKQ